MKRTNASLAFALALGFVSPGLAQTPPAAPTAADAALAAQQAAFLALPEATRKRAQDALVWLGFYNGVNDGDFGKRTREAILAFQGNVKAPADGALSPPSSRPCSQPLRRRGTRPGSGGERPKSGAKIGAPLKLLNARAGARLDFASSADADLGALYARLSTATPMRKIIYKAIKPDAFFVVSGQDGADDVLYPLRQEPDGEPAGAGIHLRLSGGAGRSAQPDRDRDRQFVRAVSGARRGAGGSARGAPSGRVRPHPEPAATALVIAPGKALTALRRTTARTRLSAASPRRWSPATAQRA